jgi:DNA-binding response OmpR family regulator
MNKSHVLIVEDEALFALMIADFLAEEYKMKCSRASTGEDAVRLAHEKKPHLILMDVRLAGKMDGIEAAQQIRKKCDAPIVFMTGYHSESIREKTLNFVPSEYLTKPVDIHELQSYVLKYCVNTVS